MITMDNIELNAEQKGKIAKYLDELNGFPGKKYPISTVVLLFSILLLIVFFIYLYEDHKWSFVLKLLTVVPIGAIVVINLRYFLNRLKTARQRNTCRKLLKSNCYPVMSVEASYCDKYSDGQFVYFIFETGKGKRLVMRSQDFEINMDEFPNNSFIIPPYELFEFVGNELVISGEKMEIRNSHRDISKLLPAMALFERGRVMVTDQI
jgi:hypothetical protein